MDLAVVFDLDGTLIDSAPDIHAIANRVLTEVDADPITLEQTRSFIGNGASVFVARMRRARGIGDGEHDRLHRAFLALYDDAVELTRPYPHVVEVLNLLKSGGARLGVCTNKPIRPAERVLQHLGLIRFFDAVFGGDSLPVQKPDAAPLLATFEALRAATGVYVGDSEVDAETAVRADVPFLLFTEGYYRRDPSEIPHCASFDSFRDLPALIEQHACLMEAGSALKKSHL